MVKNLLTILNLGNLVEKFESFDCELQNRNWNEIWAGNFDYRVEEFIIEELDGKIENVDELRLLQISCFISSID